MRKNYGFVLLIFVLCAASLRAAPVTQEQALQTAEAFFASAPLTRSAGGVRLVYAPAATRATGGDTPYYIFSPESGHGFVVVSGDDMLSPIVGYSYTSPTNGQLPDAMRAWLDEYARYVDDVRLGQTSAPSEEPQGGEAIEPLLRTTWDQGMPYNQLCPNQWPTGCVATSMAQLMKYHEWPDQGEGVLSHSAGQVDLSTYTYDWENMLDTYPLTWDDEGQQVPDGYTDEQALAVATLMRDCGYSVDMSYGQYESGAQTMRMVAALYEHFKYAPTVRYLERQMYTTTHWTDIIRSELKASRPMNYSGQTKAGAGHSFVCDGIDENDLLHINWGWSGYFDGYFDMNILAPEGIGTGGGDASGYFLEQGLVVGIRSRTEADTGVEPECRISVHDFNVSVNTGDNKWLTLSIGRIANTSMKSLYVDLQLLWPGRNGGEDVLTNSLRFRSRGDIEPCKYASNAMTEYYDLPTEPGTYPFRLVNVTNQQAGTYEPIDTGDFSDGGTLTVSEDGTVTVTMNKPGLKGELELVSATAPSALFAGNGGSVKAVFRNTGEQVLNPELFLALVPADVDETGLTDYSAYVNTSSTAGVGYIYTTQPFVYGQAEGESTCSVWKIDAPGTYKVRFCKPEWDADYNRVYLPIGGAMDQTVEVAALPDYPVYIMSGPITLSSTVFDRREAYMNVSLPQGTLTADYEGCFELWAKKKGDNAAEEFRLFTSGEFYLSAGYQSERQISGNANLTMAEPGEYEAYLKYFVQGEWRRMEGEYNSATFTVTDSEVALYYLSAPAVINGGQAVPLDGMVEVEVTLTPLKDSEGVLFIAAYTPDYYRALYMKGEMPVSLKSGESQTFKVTCYSARSSEGIPTGQYKLEIYFNPTVAEDWMSFSPGDYEASLSFELTEPLPIPLVQNSETLINGDSDMVVEQGESGHFKAEFRTEEAFHGELCLNCVDWQGKAILESTPAQTAIEPGASKEVALPFSCPMDTELAYYEYDYYARPDGYNAFGLVDKNGFSRGVIVEQYTGIEDEQAETSCRLVPQRGSFLLQGAETGSHVRVVTLGGSLVYEGTAQSTEMLIPMTGAAQGFYLVIVKDKDGKRTVLKGILK